MATTDTLIAAAPDHAAGDHPEPLTIDGLVAATPPTRERYIDFLRALSIVVVVLWHWVFSITQWTSEGSLGMPNPIGDVPALWLATWLLQIMPVFFFVGGYANLASFEGVERGGGNAVSFIRNRFRRLGKPVGIYVVLWVIGDTLARVISPSYPGVLQWGMVVFVPLWFLGVYVGVLAATPITVRLHRAAPMLTMVSLAAAIGISEILRVRAGGDELGLVTSALVWLFVHQLGFFWRDGSLERGGRQLHATLVVGGLAALVVATNLGVYPHSMVSVRGGTSNLFPTSPCIAALAVFQLGVVWMLRPAATAWLQGRRPWRFTVAMNAVAMTIFCWHMTALVAAIGAYQALGGTLTTEATAGWWVQRPLWLVLPGGFLAALVALFARFELPTPSRRDRASSPVPAPASSPPE
jgi:fucose 4-O-acetylase-like acetyltransferase